MNSRNKTTTLLVFSLLFASLASAPFVGGQTNSATITPTPSPPPTPTMLWQFTPHNYFGPGNYSVDQWSTPITIDGVVYVNMYGSRSYEKVVPHHYLPENVTITVNERWGGLYALNATTGELVWFVTTQGSRLSPSVGYDRVFAHIGDNKIGAFNISNGQNLWNFATKAGPSENLDSSATVADGTVFVGGNDGKVYALNANEGSILWTFATDGSPSIDNNHYSTPTVVDRVVYVGSNKGDLYALNAASGYKIWSLATNTTIPIVPIAVGGVVYYESGFYLHALNAENGDEIWNFTTGTILSAPEASNGVVYVNTGLWEKGDTNVRDNLYALDSTDGAVLWNSTLGGFGYGSPLFVDGVIYVGSSDNRLYALNAGNGQMIWNYTFGTAIYSNPAVVNNMVYFSSNDGVLHALKTPQIAPSPSPSPTSSIKFQDQLPLIVAIVVLAAAVAVSLALYNKHRKTNTRSNRPSQEKLTFT